MKTPFKLKFKKEVEDTSTPTIIKNFSKKFRKTRCDNLYLITDNKIRVRNNLIRFTFRWNIWQGIGTAELTVCENQGKILVSYFVDYTKMVIGHILGLCFFLVMIIPRTNNNNFQTQIILSIIVLFIVVSCLNFSFTYIEHKNLFRNVIKHGGQISTGKYDWKKILSKKTDKELLEYIRNDRGLPIKISEMARDELNRRRQI